MFEKFTDRARKAMAFANQEAQRFNHEYLGSEHILLGLVKEGEGIGVKVLKALAVDLSKVRIVVEKLVGNGPETLSLGKLPLTPSAKTTIEYAIEEAQNLHHNLVGTEHLLLGVLRNRDGVGAEILVNCGVAIADVREEILNIIGSTDDDIPAQDQLWPRRRAGHPVGRTAPEPLSFLIEPGSATAEDLAELFSELSALYRMLGGSGITFKFIDAREPAIA